MGGSVGSDDGDMGFQIAPMVDVVFVLLLFFMASAGSQVVEKELTINLPAGKSSTGAQVTPIIIDIGADGAITMNNQSYGNPTDKNLTQLREWLTVTVKDYDGKDPVIIRPTNDTKQDRIIDVLNACAFAGVKNLTFS